LQNGSFLILQHADCNINFRFILDKHFLIIVYRHCMIVSKVNLTGHSSITLVCVGGSWA